MNLKKKKLITEKVFELKRKYKKFDMRKFLNLEKSIKNLRQVKIFEFKKI